MTHPATIPDDGGILAFIAGWAAISTIGNLALLLNISRLTARIHRLEERYHRRRNA